MVVRSAQSKSVISRDQFIANLSDSGLFSPDELKRCLSGTPAAQTGETGGTLARWLAAAGTLTDFQADAVRDRRFDELLIGNYEVLDRLGAGGMGVVYKARHRKMKRTVAVKVLSRAIADSPTFIKRFQREVEVVARLIHPNIVIAFDADEAAVGHYLVMEFVDGRDLATDVLELGPMSVRAAVDCIAQAAAGLGYVHEQGIWHRDVKPANLLRDANGVVKVADLGVARLNSAPEQSESVRGLTEAGGMLGTVDYIAPEQALDSTSIDRRADVYSLGCSLYYLLVGEPLYSGTTFLEVLIKHREAPIPSLCERRPDAPAALEAVYRKMAAKLPEERFASMSEVITALRAIQLPENDAPLLVGDSVDAVNKFDATSAFDTSAIQSVAPLSMQPPAAPALAPSMTAIDESAPTFLLAEPSRAQALIIRGYVRQIASANVVTTPSGREALERIKRDRPSMVISSMQLADMTGVELAERVKAEGWLSSTGFVLIFSETDAGQATQLSLDPRIARLSKPFSLDQLDQALAKAKGGKSADAASQIGAPTADLRVLIVDDSAPARRYVREVFASIGVGQPAEAHNGLHAAAMLQQGRFDLVVTDYNMPGMDGRELVEFIRQRSPLPDVPIVMFTTETNRERLDAVWSAGINDIWDKRFNPDKMREFIDREIRKSP